MFIENNTQRYAPTRRALPKGQQVRAQQLDGMFDFVADVVKNTAGSIVDVAKNTASLVPIARDVALSPFKLAVALPVGIISGAAGGRGISGAIQGAQAATMFSAGSLIPGRMYAGGSPTFKEGGAPVQVQPSASYALPFALDYSSLAASISTLDNLRSALNTAPDNIKPLIQTEINNANTQISNFQRQIAINTPPLTANANVGQASYGAQPYTPSPIAQYDSDGNVIAPKIEPVKAPIPWGAIATGALAISTLMSK